MKASPFDSPDSLRRPGPSNTLAYPQLGTLAPGEIANDLEFLFGHRRNAGMILGPYGHPAAGQPVFDQYNGMGMLDGPGARFPPHMPFQQGPMPPQPVPPPMVQGFPGLAPPPSRLQHHSSAPSGSMPMSHSQILMEQEFAAGAHRPASGPVHPSSQMQYPSAGPPPRNRRSLSPLPMHAMNNGSNTAMGPGPSSRSSRIPAGAGSSSRGAKDGKRGDPLMHGLEVDHVMAEKEREHRRIMDPREERDWGRDLERERQFRQERDYELEMERSGHLPLQRLPSHSHQHAHAQSSQAPHGHGPHHHHHHHHVVHRHHHAGSVNGVGPSGPPQGAIPRETSNGIGPGAGSPHIPRDIEPQRGHIVPVEVIELSSSAQQHVSSHAYPRMGPEEQLPPHSDSGRDRARGPGGSSLPERSNPPFVSPPMQSSHGTFPSSPRAAQGLSTAPASIAPSRRGSWSAPDGPADPRPSSSASSRLSTLPVSQRLPASALPNRAPQLSPTSQPHRSPMLSPRNGGIRLPPLSPSHNSSLRSPMRNSQALPGIPLPPPSGGHSKSSSPQVSRRSSPPLRPPSRPRSPLTRERALSGVAPQSIPSGQKHSRMSPVNIFPAPVSQPTPLPTSRLPNVGVDTEANLVPAPTVNAVPVD